MSGRVYRLNRHTWIKKVLVVPSDDGEGTEEVEIHFAVRPPNRKLQGELEKVYREAAAKRVELGNDGEVPEALMDLADRLRAVMTPEAVADHVFDWKNVADANGQPLPFSRDRLLAAFESDPILYMLAVEAIQDAIPQRRAEVEKNS